MRASIKKIYTIYFLIGLVAVWTMYVECAPTRQDTGSGSENQVKKSNRLDVVSQNSNSISQRKPKTLSTLFNTLGSMSLIPGLRTLLSMNGGTQFEFIPLGRLLYNSYVSSSRQNRKSS